MSKLSARKFAIAAVGVLLIGSATAETSNTTHQLNPQPIPPGKKKALNPQPIPPGKLNALNPQPIPPGHKKKSKRAKIRKP